MNNDISYILRGEIMTCTFFGHRDCSDPVGPRLREIITDLVENEGVRNFLVGDSGRFDMSVRFALRDVKKCHPEMNYVIVLAYFPEKKQSDYWNDYSETIIPEGIENVHPRYAVNYRNNWMIDNSDLVVTYVTHTWGCSSRFVDRARKKGTRIISVLPL